ncbi:Fc receptor-like protein 4 [Sorex fumeus]|uniref:Fc receptor-like protein 4 n=1 Tax=Sorex fumeus TaxID=62283 RepID=UPI0024ADF230|nr:Fc receptor-like protein 4 [Sorex fumeus]
MPTAHQSVISIRPPWTTFFKGAAVKMICNGSDDYVTGQTQYIWYDHKNIRDKTTGNNLTVRDSGMYRCQAPGSLPSKPVNLLFSSGSLILQTPTFVFEGDSFILRCKKRGRGRGRRKELTDVKYIRNGKIISNFNKSLDLFIPQARLNDSGSYQCIGIENKMYKFRSNFKIIKIQELFPDPTLNITDLQPEEGSSVTLICGVQLPPERQDTLLHFIFYRDNGVVLSKWSRSPEFQISNIWRKDSGVYWCGAEAVLNNISKHSLPRQIHVQKAGFPGDNASSCPTPRPKESPQHMCPDAMELQVVDGNAHLKEGNMVYSEIQMICVKEEGNDIGKDVKVSPPLLVLPSQNDFEVIL